MTVANDSAQTHTRLAIHPRLQCPAESSLGRAIHQFLPEGTGGTLKTGE